MKRLLAFLFYFLLPFSPIFTQIDLENGLLAYYPFDGDGVDMSLFENHAIELQGTQPIIGCDGLENKAIYLDGHESFIKFPFSNQLSFETEDAFSISIWIKIPETQQNDLDGTVNDILVKWNNSGSVPYPFTLRYLNSNHDKYGKIAFGRFDSEIFGCAGSSVIFSSAQVNDDKWHNIIIVRSQNGIFDLYIDGISNGSLLDNSNCTVQNNLGLMIGSRLTNPTFRVLTGGVDNLRIYNRVLTFDEIEFLSKKLVNNTIHKLKNDEVYIYPNPLKNTPFQVNGLIKEDIYSFEFIDLSGKSILSLLPNEELPNLPNGIYLVKIISKSKVTTTKIVISK